MTDLNIDELYADVIASASPTGYIRKTLRALVEKLKVDDVFVPHDVSLTVLRSDRTALLIGDIAAELERDGWSIVPVIPGWTTSVNGPVKRHLPPPIV